MAKQNLFKYLLAKKSEVRDLKLKDVLLAKTVIDIHRHKTGSSMCYVPLSSLTSIHAIDRENARRSLQKRIVQLRQHKADCLQRGDLSKEYMLSLLPSVSGIKVVQVGNDWVAFEGNGRMEAFKAVFRNGDAIRLQVEVYQVDAPQKIARRVRRVQRHNQLITKSFSGTR